MLRNLALIETGSSGEPPTTISGADNPNVADVGITIPQPFLANPRVTAPNESKYGDTYLALPDVIAKNRKDIDNTIGALDDSSNLLIYNLMLSRLAETGESLIESFQRARNDHGLTMNGLTQSYPHIIEYIAYIADTITTLEQKRSRAVQYQDEQARSAAEQAIFAQIQIADTKAYNSERLDFQDRIESARDSGFGLRGVEEDIRDALAAANTEARKRLNDTPTRIQENFARNNSVLLAHIDYLRAAQLDVALIREKQKSTLKLQAFSREIELLQGHPLHEYLRDVVEPEIAATDALIDERYKTAAPGTTVESFKANHSDLLDYADRLETLHVRARSNTFPILRNAADTNILAQDAPPTPAHTTQTNSRVALEDTPPAPIYTTKTDMFGAAPIEILPATAKTEVKLPDWSYHPSKELTEARKNIPRLVKQQAILESYLQAEREKMPKGSNKKVEAAKEKIFQNAYPNEHQRLADVKKLIQATLDEGESAYRKHYREIMINDLRVENNHLMPHFIAHLESELESPRAERMRLVQDLYSKARHDPSRKDEVARMKAAHAQAKSRVRYMEDLLLRANHSYEIRNRPDYEPIMECEPAIDPRKLLAASSNKINQLGSYDESVFDDNFLRDDEREVKISAFTHLDDLMEPILIPLAAGAQAIGKVASKGKIALTKFVAEKISPRIEAAKQSMAGGYKATKEVFFKSLLQPKKFAGYTAAAIGTVGVVAIGASALMSNGGNSTADADNVAANGNSKNIYVSIADSWNKVKGDVLSPAANKEGRLLKIVSDIEKLKALTKDMGQVTVGAVTEAPVAATAAISPAAAQTTPSAESNAVSAANAPVVKVNFRQAVTTPDYAKPIVKTPKVTVAGVAMTFDAETHKKTCEFMKNQGLSSWVCDAAASPAPNV